MTVCLVRPLYLEFDARGRLSRIFCKGCGKEIAKQTDRGMIRAKNYAEIKMSFADGSFHITNLCTGCAKAASKSSEFLSALHGADMDQMEAEDDQFALLGYRGRNKPKLVKSRFDGKPLL